MGKDQHYTPAMHMVLFSDDKRPNRQNRTRIVGLAEAPPETWSHSRRRVASIGHLYHLYEKYGSRYQQVENLFGVIETMAAPILKKLAKVNLSFSKACFTINSADYKKLSLYLVTLQIRQPHTLNPSLTEILDLALNKNQKEMVQHDLSIFLEKAIAQELQVLIPISHLVVLAKPVPLNINMPYSVINRQTDFHIAPSLLLKVHTEYPIPTNQQINIPVYKEIVGEYEESQRIFLSSIQDNPTEKFQYIYPIKERDFYKEHYFNRTEEICDTQPKERIAWDDQAGNFFSLKLIPQDSLEGRAAGLALQELNQKDNDKIRLKREFLSKDTGPTTTGLNQTALYFTDPD